MKKLTIVFIAISLLLVGLSCEKEEIIQQQEASESPILIPDGLNSGGLKSAGELQTGTWDKIVGSFPSYGWSSTSIVGSVGYSSSVSYSTGSGSIRWVAEETVIGDACRIFLDLEGPAYGDGLVLKLRFDEVGDASRKIYLRVWNKTEGTLTTYAQDTYTSIYLTSSGTWDADLGWEFWFNVQDCINFWPNYDSSDDYGLCIETDELDGGYIDDLRLGWYPSDAMIYGPSMDNVSYANLNAYTAEFYDPLTGVEDWEWECT